jgi:outer membrane protein TolC
MKAQSEAAAASQNMARVYVGLRQRLATTFERYPAARAQVERYESTILPAAIESLPPARETFRSGESNDTSLLTVQRTLLPNEPGVSGSDPAAALHRAGDRWPSPDRQPRRK